MKYFFWTILLGFCACSAPTEQKFPLALQELTDESYPDNPDIGFRSSEYSFDFFQSAQILPQKGDSCDFQFILNNGSKIEIPNLSLHEFIPSFPAFAKTPYLQKIAIINQEWNRNQVALYPGEFNTTDTSIVRIDLARNCLNSYLWELIIYTEEESKTTPLAHAWFDFPHEYYQRLFQARNGMDFGPLAHQLEHWSDPENDTIQDPIMEHNPELHPIKYSDLCDEMYPLAGARLKKKKEIIVPRKFSSMRDLLTDSTLFATFSPPGFYNKKDPRTTELGRFNHITGVQMLKSKNSNYPTFVLAFEDKEKQRKTELHIGGVDLQKLPLLAKEDANKGWKNSMGFGNHPFYENLESHLKWDAKSTPYYAYLCDQDQRWLDSHKIGIDGPIFHWDKNQPELLHLWLLSFERHALVGHYTLTIPTTLL